MRTWKRRLASKTTQYFVPNYKPNPNLMKNLWKSRAFFPPRSYQRNEISNSKQQRQRTWWRSHGKESFVKNHNISIKKSVLIFHCTVLKTWKKYSKSNLCFPDTFSIGSSGSRIETTSRNRIWNKNVGFRREGDYVFTFKSIKRKR